MKACRVSSSTPALFQEVAMECFSTRPQYARPWSRWRKHLHVCDQDRFIVYLLGTIMTKKHWTVFSFTSNSAGWEYLVTLLYHICWRLPNGWQFQFWLILSISHTKHSNERWGQWVNTECPCQGGLVPWLYSVGGSHKKFITHLVCQTLINILPPPPSNVWA